MPDKDKSDIYDVLNRFVNNWENIYLKVYQDGKWQSLSLDKIRDDKIIANFVIKCLT